ncbi:MAG TPA: dTDP-4-dehydrorhamnose 3,5-epimerase [Ferruginibacter sp.]|nr:dTDP-4-dehydrorhamnose 3,5-epimerase [Ferruginibacter sp.]HRE62395.1 dTDP-4-dehydrorhamnose 3,5-epimerase [Ferruginibacter sp.]
MIFTETKLKGSYIINLEPRGDNRGWFARTYCKNEFEQVGLNTQWVQTNHSFTSTKGSIRGLHYQQPPYAEVKLVRCIAGSVFDVIVDCRKNSATYLQWVGVELSAGNKTMIYIPEGFAHGFQTLSADAELIYQHSQFYTPAAEAGILYNDANIGIQWPLPLTEISDRDRSFPTIHSNFKPI